MHYMVGVIIIVERQCDQIFRSMVVKVFLRVSLSVLSLTAAGSVLAQSTEAKIPQELLALDQKRCENDCIPGFGEETCKPLCACTVNEFQQRLDFDKYLELTAQLARNEMSGENTLLLDVIAKKCTAEVEKAGIVIGRVDDAQKDEVKPN